MYTIAKSVCIINYIWQIYNHTILTNYKLQLQLQFKNNFAIAIAQLITILVLLKDFASLITTRSIRDHVQFHN